MNSDRSTQTAAFLVGPSWRWYAFATLALAIGAVLRLAWGQDIEFKYDEAYMFQRAMNAGRSEPFPWVGMSSGAGVANPGASTWIFIAMVRLFGVQTPPGLARVVQVCNVFALVLSMALGFFMWERSQQKPWIWAIALACVNPFAVLFDRKIWAQSMLPLFCALMIIGWSKRGTRWGAVLWGLVGAWLGQIHMSGFFLATALVLWTVLHDRAIPPSPETARVRWRPWIAGSALGAVTLVPWIWHLLIHGTGARQQDYLAALLGHNTLGLWYWILWITGALGLGMSYSLGATEFMAFMRYPVIWGAPTFAVAAAHLALLLVGAWVLMACAWHSRHKPILRTQVFLGEDDDTDRLVKASLYGTGVLLTLAGFPIQRHYLIVAFPLAWLWLVRLTRSATMYWHYVLVSIWLCELVIATGFLYYIHVNHGAVTGDYGGTYLHSR